MPDTVIQKACFRVDKTEMKVALNGNQNYLKLQNDRSLTFKSFACE